MVQVISAEIFNLPNTITGHVTYKTTLTRRGVWALTVGIVDPGWTGPVSTTLLNFSDTPYLVMPGDTFLRVSLFKHPPVSEGLCIESPSIPNYTGEIQKIAASFFPKTFLNTDDITRKTLDAVVDWIKHNGVLWLAAAAGILALIQVIAISLQIGLQFWQSSDQTDLQKSLLMMETRINELELKSRNPGINFIAPSEHGSSSRSTSQTGMPNTVPTQADILINTSPISTEPLSTKGSINEPRPQTRPQTPQ